MHRHTYTHNVLALFGWVDLAYIIRTYTGTLSQRTYSSLEWVHVHSFLFIVHATSVHCSCLQSTKPILAAVATSHSSSAVCCSSSHSKSLERLRKFDVSGATGAKLQKSESCDKTSTSPKLGTKARVTLVTCQSCDLLCIMNIIIVPYCRVRGAPTLILASTRLSK